MIQTLRAPLVGGRLMWFFSYLLIDNRADLAGTAKATYMKLFPWVVLLIFVLGVVRTAL